MNAQFRGVLLFHKICDASYKKSWNNPRVFVEHQTTNIFFFASHKNFCPVMKTKFNNLLFKNQDASFSFTKRSVMSLKFEMPLFGILKRGASFLFFSVNRELHTLTCTLSCLSCFSCVSLSLSLGPHWSVCRREKCPAAQSAFACNEAKEAKEAKQVKEEKESSRSSQKLSRHSSQAGSPFRTSLLSSESQEGSEESKSTFPRCIFQRTSLPRLSRG